MASAFDKGVKDAKNSVADIASKTSSGVKLGMEAANDAIVNTTEKVANSRLAYGTGVVAGVLDKPIKGIGSVAKGAANATGYVAKGAWKSTKIGAAVVAGLAALGAIGVWAGIKRAETQSDSRDALHDMGNRSLDTQLAMNSGTLMGQPLVLNGEHGSRVLAARGGSRAVDTSNPALSITDQPVQTVGV